MTKLPHNISTQDLLNALEGAEDTETTEWSNDVPHFLSKFQMEEGENKVKVDLLYKLYKLYSKYPVRQQEFTMTVSQFIPCDGKYYKINVKPMRIAKVVNTQSKIGLVRFTTSLSIKRHYERFLHDNSVKKGITWVEGLILYEVYRRYCIDKKFQLRMTYMNFIKVTKLYFKHKVIRRKSTWLQIDNEIIQRLLTPEIIEQVNSRRKKTPEKIKEKIRIAYRRRKRGKKSKKT